VPRSETFRSLRHSNARLFFVGMLVSQIGTWMQTTAQVLLVLRLTGKGTDLGAVMFFQFIPMLVLGAWAGAVADRVNRRRMTIITQSLMTVQAAGLAVLDLTGHATLLVVELMALALGVLAALDNPARRGLLTQLVDEGDISNALSLNTAVMTGSRVFGPALAGMVVARVGTGWCFVANAVSFLAVLGGLLAMNTAEIRAVPPTPRPARPVRDGLAFVWRDPLLRRTFVVLVVVATFAFNYQVSIALLNRKLHGGKASFGWLMAVNSVGSVIGSLIVAARRVIALRDYVVATAVLGVASIAIGASSSLLVAFLVAVPLGIGGAGFIACSNAIVQPRTPPPMRGRVLALQSTAFLGSTPIGAPITGWVGDHIGAGWSIAYGGVISLVTVGLLAAMPRFAQRARTMPAAEAVGGPR
jgi:MFS family permease